MMYRFDQCKYICEYNLEATHKYIVSKIDTSNVAGERTITLFNPSQKDFSGILTVDLETPQNPLAPSYFNIFGQGGEEVAYQLLSLTKGHIRTIIQKSAFPLGEAVDLYTVAFKAEIPAFGYSTYSYVHYPPESIDFKKFALNNERTPVRYSGTQMVSSDTAENEFLKVSIRENGMADVFDKETGRTYTGLLQFEDEADIGDGWVYKSPVESELIKSCGRQACVSVVHDGPLKTTFRIRLSMLLPSKINQDRTARKKEYLETDITTELTLVKGERTIRCKTVIDNNVRDHRMKLLFPSNIYTDRYYTSNAFDFTERKIPKRDYGKYREEAQYTVPNHGVVALDDDECGIAVFNKGLYEVEARDDQSRTIALTLFRSTGTEVANISHDGGQMQRRLEFGECDYKRGQESGKRRAGIYNQAVQSGYG